MGRATPASFWAIALFCRIFVAVLGSVEAHPEALEQNQLGDVTFSLDCANYGGAILIE